MTYALRGRPRSCVSQSIRALTWAFASRGFSSVVVVCGPSADFLRTVIMAKLADNHLDNRLMKRPTVLAVRPVEA